MRSLIKKLKYHKSVLDQSEFCNYLKNQGIPAQKRIEFVNSMIFFVMGFRDILTCLTKQANPSPIQKIVNDHCEEDSTHWDWYLKDLEILNALYQYKNNSTKLIRYIWSKQNWNIRDNIYENIHMAKGARSPFIRLVIIQVLEATFASFNGATHPLVKELNLYNKLAYFGQNHVNAEESHSFDNWVEVNEEEIIEKTKASEKEISLAHWIIDRLFLNFSKMFQTWYNNHAIEKTLERSTTEKVYGPWPTSTIATVTRKYSSHNLSRSH